MSTTVVPNASEVPGPDVEITPLPGYPDPLVAIRLCGHPDRLANVSRADFLAAVETECGVRTVPADAIVIERADVPEVTPSGGCSGVGGVHFLSAAGHEIADTSDASLVRVHALALLALAEYLAAHPPTPPVTAPELAAAGLLVDLLATVKAEGMREAESAVRAVFDLQCPVRTDGDYIPGAAVAHRWWETVLGGRLRDLRERADDIARGDS